MYFLLKIEDDEDPKFIDTIEWIFNAFGIFVLEKKELMDNLLNEIMNKATFTEEDRERYKEYIIKNKMTPEDIENEAMAKKYCQCKVIEKEEKNRFECEIDDRLGDAVSEKDFLKTQLALMEILYGYRDIALKILNGKLEELKTEIV